jgi:hypothetical protein
MSLEDFPERSPELLALLALLKEGLMTPAGTPDWAVEDFPDKPQSYRLTHPNGAVLVQYTASQYGKSETLDWVVQQRQQHWRLVLLGRQQYGAKKGVVTMLNRLTRLLPGKQLGACEPIQLLRDYFVRQDEGLWEYCIEFSMASPVVGHAFMQEL